MISLSANGDIARAWKAEIEVSDRNAAMAQDVRPALSPR